MTGAPTASEPLRAAVLTVSSSRAAAGGSDESGDALVALVEELGGALVERQLVADDWTQIESALRRLADGGGCDLVLTTGGTGFAASDVTPEATEAVLERRAPGIAEAMRAASAPHTPHWMLSRATAGIRAATLIVNFPGNPKAIAETAQVLLPALPHAVSLLRDAPTAHRQ
ncbi:MAG TPA: MogA/MoaB family molybdenum cofactor biosynthesis protein [Solirubrobacterales bacterium]|nr:MogA/MoaB family molybdenum cofactor biosynthesis protein [Solirubrobacterales bacterium]